ncbi:MAG TPA: MoxR family ATPase [Blastocatellia bacterium]|nr:MoxR family ATPase [Blastocatellia bacterium]HMV83607.1 MoxR family ATPase [Blastocatellia bacterium]HMX26567.1 MoxR family ATPase [Blastocatellia bacterium]HMY73516.1 MoxR family ATPase [Blastocatellia bacterium]HMZ22319.1 MoxR family ATPase [Blastocatellia bacterium]
MANQIIGHKAAQKWNARFSGDKKQPEKKHHKDAYSEAEPYVTPPELARAVNLAIHLGRPLLLEGEAGCGKTRLARKVAFELGLPLFTWQVRSTSKAQEGLYSYDSLLRLRDAGIQRVAADKPVEMERDPANPEHYYKLGALGDAFDLKECAGVVLIDEIDKADLDFPNDLLTVLDKPWAFDIPDTKRTVSATHIPIVIITSNKEKGNLPHPFLRRCVYFHVDFPGEDDLKTILTEHFRNERKQTNAKLLNEATDKFSKLRRTGNLHKKPGTSEFIDWVTALHDYEDQNANLTALQTETQLPYPELLYKLRNDWPRADVSR